GIRDATVTGVQTCALPILPVVHRLLLRSFPHNWGSGTLRAVPAPFPRVRHSDAQELLDFGQESANQIQTRPPRAVRPFPTGQQRSEERRVGKEWRTQANSW